MLLLLELSPGPREQSSFTPVLKYLHQLPISYSIDAEVVLLVYKSLISLGPEYISDLFKDYKPSKALRSMDSGQLVEPTVQTKHDEAALRCYAACN